MHYKLHLKFFLAFVGHRQTAKPCKEKTDDKSVACCTCRSRYNMHSLVQSITNSVRTLVKTTEKNKGKTKKERNSALFLQILSISMYVLFGYFGKDARVSPFRNYLQKIHNSLMKFFLIDSTPIKLSVYPNTWFFDNLLVQRKNDIEWKVKVALEGPQETQRS